MSTYRAVPLTRRAQHEERLLHLLRERGARSRAEIADELRMSRATLSEVASGLLRRGAIVVHETDAAVREGSGRPAERLALDPACGQFLGVDMAHHRTRVAIADASHTVLAEDAVAYDPGTRPDDRVGITFGLIDDLIRRHRLHLRALQGIAVGVPGPFSARPGNGTGTTTIMVDARPGSGGRLTSAGAGDDQEPPAWTVGDRIRRAFEERYDVPVLLGNNTRFAALAEAVAVPGESVPDLVYVRLAGGVGGGLVVGGQLVTGWAGAAGEFGHVLAEPGGERCRCGRDGCLETVASVPAVLKKLDAMGLPVDSIAGIEPGDEPREQVLREAAAPLGRLLAVHAISLNPSEIVIGGELGTHPVILEQVRAVVTDHLGVFAVAAPRVRAARLADDDGCLGALTALYHRSPLVAPFPDVTAEQAARQADRQADRLLDRTREPHETRRPA